MAWKKDWKTAGQKLRQYKEKAVALFDRRKNVNFFGKEVMVYPARLTTSVVVLALVLIFLLNIFFPVGGKKEAELDFDAGGDYRQTAYGNNLLIYNNAKIKEVNKKGKDVWSADIYMTNPAVDVGGDYVVAADLEGQNSTYVYKNGRQLHEYKVGYTVFAAKISENGYTAIAHDASGYKGRITVYDPDGNEAFVWNSGDGYLTDIDISDNGRYVAAAQIMTDGEETYSRLRVLDVRRQTEVSTTVRDGVMMSCLKFYGNDKIVAVSDRDLSAYTRSGSLRYEVSFVGKNPSAFCIESERVMTFVTMDSRGNDLLEIYGADGKLRGTYTAEGKLNNVTVCGNTIVANERREVLRISPSGKVKKRVQVSHDIKLLGLYGDGNDVLAIGNTEANIVKVR